MRIVIVGDGKVGSTAALELSLEGHDVIVIDSNGEVLDGMKERMDIICIEGNGATVEIQERAGVQHADVLIAATSLDEVNLLCCLLGKKLGAKHTIARVRNPEYFAQMGLLKKELGLSMAVNPELAAASEMSRLLRFPSALKIEPFARGRVELVELKIPEDNILDGMPLFEIYKKLQVKVLICAVQRKDEIFIPKGDFVLQSGDKIHVTASHREIAQFVRAMGTLKNSVKSVMIVGGGRVAYYLAKELLAVNIMVKIVDKKQERCEYLCEELPEAIIIRGDGTDRELLLEEGLEKTDALVMLTGMDEENIIVSLYAKLMNVSKVIAKVDRISFHEVLNTLDIDSVISPKELAANNMVRFIRSLQNSEGSNNVVTLHRLLNDNVEALEFQVEEISDVVDVPLKELKVKDGILVATIIRRQKVIIPGGNDSVQKGDSVIIVTTEKHLIDLDDILQKKGLF